ncbi:hypothetical protein SH449x_001748 [Pirellulaceae bacterium SH449]
MTQKLTVKPLPLTFLMLFLVLGPVGFGVFLYSRSKYLGEPPLPVEIKFGTQWVNSEKLGERLVPCITIRNTSEKAWKKLSVGLNEQFYNLGGMVVEAESEVSVPLESFISRNGSVRFPVGNRPIKHVIVFAQIHTGARGVSEFRIDPPNESTPTDWMQPVSE